MIKIFIFISLINLMKTFEIPELNEWNEYKVKHELKFDKLVESKKFENFKKTRDKIYKHNKEFGKSVSYKLGLNSKSHYSNKEFKKRFLFDSNVKELIREKVQNFTQNTNIENVKSSLATKPPVNYWNWVERNVVSRVRDQQYCGSCYTFATTGSVESALAIKFPKKRLFELSKQQILDCSNNPNYGNMGCEGGFIDNTFSYIIDNKLMKDSDYPYITGVSECKNNITAPRYGITGYGFLETGDTAGMKKALIQYGPLVAYMAASNFDVLNYRSGVLDSKNCDPKGVDHVVLIVGFGTCNLTKKNYWLVKNTWGVEWGEKGYIRIQRDKNMCGIETSAYYSIV